DAAEADCAAAAKAEPQSLLPELVRAGITAARGNPAEAVMAAESLLERAPPHDGKVLYAAACVFSLAAQAEMNQAGGTDSAAKARDYSDRGAQLLAEVLGTCFHDLQYPEHNHMAWDPALESLRKLPEVARLLEGRK